MSHVTRTEPDGSESEPIEPQASQNALKRRRRMGRLTEWLIVFVGLVILVALLLPATRSVRPAARRMQCQNQLRLLAAAILNYESERGAFPPAYTVDAEGKPLHSWRTLILPYLDQSELYDSIDLSKPWDDPANQLAYEKELTVFGCPSAKCPANFTTYFAIVTPHSCLQPGEPRMRSDITDGIARTTLLIEANSDDAVHWMSPHDANETLVFAFNGNSKLPHESGPNMAMLDGRVTWLDPYSPDADRRAFISIAGSDRNPSWDD